MSVAALVGGAGDPAAAGCGLRPGETGVVSRIIDGETVMLDSGLEVRLIGAMAPTRPADIDARHPWPLADRVEYLLATLALGKPARLFYGGRRRDRNGRALAHVFVITDDLARKGVSDTADAPAAKRPGRLWLQGALVDAGLARVYSYRDNRACLDTLLERETRARDAGNGLWRDREYARRGALDIARLHGDLNSFQIVEGKVHAVANVRGRLYLNFEANWRRDFTVAIGRRALAGMMRGGFNPALLDARHIRVRGWVDRRNGPLIAVTHREQIEVIESP